MRKKLILLFGIYGEKLKQIKNLCRTLDILVFSIKRKQYEEKLGVLAGIVGMKKNNKVYMGQELPGEMMVFSGVDSDELDVFLERYKAAGIEPVGLKAVLTPVNVNWTPEELFRELVKEKEEMK